MTQLINAEKFTYLTNHLRKFFFERGFYEVHTQNRLSILAACEDPATIATFQYSDTLWPLSQTGQMWLEYELLTKPKCPGFFCLSTSYRQEQDPIEGRHELVFPMFEFEFPGTITDLETMERDLLYHLELATQETILCQDYATWCDMLNTNELETQHENMMAQQWPDYVCMIKNFPNTTSPFWNMRQNGDGTAAKIDVIIAGQETIGSAERSCNPQEMREMFYTISEGRYAALLFETFGKERVEAELDAFLGLNFFPRVGGGIGLTRMIRALDRCTKSQAA